MFNILRTEHYFLYSYTFTLPKCQCKYLNHQSAMQRKPGSFFFSLPTLSIGHPIICYLPPVQVFGTRYTPTARCNVWVDHMYLQILETLPTLSQHPRKLGMRNKNLASFTGVGFGGLIHGHFYFENPPQDHVTKAPLPHGLVCPQ